MFNTNRFAILVFLLFSFTANTFAGDENKLITLTDSNQIKDAMALDDAINKISAKVSECIEQKLAPPQKCFCLYPTELQHFKNKYKTALKHNPGWRGRNVFWTLKGEPTGYTLSFPGLRRQMELKCE